jgi:hypothetical protein
MLLLPWLPWWWERGKVYLGIQWTSPTRPLTEAYFSDYGTYLVYLLGPARNYFLIFLASLGLVWAWQDSRIRILTGWGLLLSLGVIPWGLRFSPFRPDHLAIVLFLPVCILAAHFAGEALTRLKRKVPRCHPETLALTLLLALLIWGLKETRFIIKPETILAGADDRQALRWIEAHTPAGARFLIRPVPWEWGLYRGLDGGYWITSLTGRWTSLPPIFYGYGTREMIHTINQRAKQTLEAEGCGPAFWELTRNLAITYVYTREGDGPLSPRALAGCPGLEPAYQGGRVYLFKIP